MNQHEWHPGVAEQLGFYVYLLIDPRDDAVFYVGKGVGDRCFEHLAEARATSRDEQRGYGKLKQIRDIEDEEMTARIDVLRSELSEDEALLVEGAAIDLLGLDTLTNKVLGHGAGRETVDDINARLGATPAVFAEDDDLLLIRVSRRFRSGMSEHELYEVTRKWWRLGDRRCKVTHALAVHAGVVRDAYQIDGWEQPNSGEIAEDGRRLGRWGFCGQSDAAMRDRFLFTDVTAVFSQGSRNPVRYIGC